MSGGRIGKCYSTTRHRLSLSTANQVRYDGTMVRYGTVRYDGTTAGTVVRYGGTTAGTVVRYGGTMVGYGGTVQWYSKLVQL